MESVDLLNALTCDADDMDPNANLWEAAGDGNMERIKALLAADSSLGPNSKDDNGYTPMHAAAAYSHIALLDVFKELGGDVNARDSDGDTPLHHCESEEAIAWLFAHGADFTLKNAHGQTALEKLRLELQESQSTGQLATDFWAKRAAFLEMEKHSPQVEEEDQEGKRQCNNPTCPSPDVPKLMACARCGKALYCGRDCQVNHWKNGHKALCKPK